MAILIRINTYFAKKVKYQVQKKNNAKCKKIKNKCKNKCIFFNQKSFKFKGFIAFKCKKCKILIYITRTKKTKKKIYIINIYIKNIASKMHFLHSTAIVAKRECGSYSGYKNKRDVTFWIKEKQV